MKSEELEQSLRTEFESYLKTVIAEMRQEADEFQSRAAAEFEKHKAGFDEAFNGYTARFEAEHAFDDAFTGTVGEHLRLARDEGARIATVAMEEAEKLTVPPEPVEVKYNVIRDAVADISSKDSQSAILKSLVQHAEGFAPRGAFFIIKNDQFVGWKVFGADDEEADKAVREIHFPKSDDSILGDAVKSSTTVDAAAGSYADDTKFLEPLGFGQADRSHAIPLIARGRGVAALYVDYGQEGVSLNLEALETLVRVAGLTVELLAATQTAKAENRVVGAADFEDAGPEPEETPYTTAFDETFRSEPFAMPAPEAQVAEVEEVAQPADETEDETPGFAFSESVSYEGGFPPGTIPESAFEPAPEVENTFETFDAPVTAAEPVADSPFGYPTINDFDTVETDVKAIEYEIETAGESTPFEPVANPVAEVEDAGSPFDFDSAGTVDPILAPAVRSPFETSGTIELTPATSPFDKAPDIYEPAAVAGAGGFGQVTEQVIDAPITTPPTARLSDRPVDLPIEVPEEERRIHNDARRFARLLVSEIKLYNEKKVTEGREASDLYDRLREAIDRSREMYDKRVQPPVAAKFDYFHYELVNSLADGDASRLGQTYSGASV